MRNSARAPKRGRGTAHTGCMCIMKLAEKYLTRKNSAMSGQNSVCLDTMTEQCVKVIFGSAYMIFFGGGVLFWNSEIDKKHTFLGECGGIPPQKSFD